MNSEFHVDKDFLETILKQNDPKLNNSFRITKFGIVNGTKIGENFVGEIGRISYSYEHNGVEYKDLKLFVKAKPENPAVYKVFESFGMYRTEIIVYQSLLPVFEKILLEAGIKVQLGPKLVYADLEKDAFINQDATVDGYGIVNKDQRLSLEEVKMVLRKLAHFHAASVVYNQRHDQCLTKWKLKLFDEFHDGITPMLNGMLSAFIAKASQWQDMQCYLPKLKEMRKNFKPIADETVRPVKGFNCLNHGDPWFSNILVKKSNSEPDILLIDFQLASWGSPVLDLHYLFSTSLNEEDYRKRTDELIQFYHGILADTLIKLKFGPVPSLLELQMDYLQKYFHEIWGGVIVKSLITRRGYENFDTDDLLNNDATDSMEKNFENPRFQEELKYLVKFLDRKGILDLQPQSH